MLSFLKKYIIGMQKLPFTVSPSLSNIILHSQESGESWLEFVGWYESERKYARIRFKFHRLIGIKMCGLGGEADSHGIGEVELSKWLNEINQVQRKAYPEHADNFKDVHHFYVAGHDKRVEFLAEGFSWEVIEELPSYAG